MTDDTDWPADVPFPLSGVARSAYHLGYRHALAASATDERLPYTGRAADTKDDGESIDRANQTARPGLFPASATDEPQLGDCERCGGTHWTDNHAASATDDEGPHKHSIDGCGVMIHVVSQHYMDEPCTRTGEHRCRFEPYRHPTSASATDERPKHWTFVCVLPDGHDGDCSPLAASATDEQSDD